MRDSEPLDAWILECYSKGMTQLEISKTVGLSKSAVSRRIKKLREKAHESISEWASKTLPWEFSRAVKSMEIINRQAFQIAEKADDDRTKLNALALAKDANTAKIDLLTHTSNIDSVIQWANRASKKLEKENDTPRPSEDISATATQ